MSQWRYPALDIVFDIETDICISEDLYAELVADVKPDGRLKDPEKIQADIDKKKAAIVEEAALKPSTAQIVSIAAKVVSFDRDGGDRFHSHGWVRTLGNYTEANVSREPFLLQEFAEFVENVKADTPRLRLVSYNGRRFDIPFLAARMILWGVHAHRILTNSRTTHLDLVDVLPGGLGRWGTLIGHPKLEASGKSVRGMVEAGDWDRLERYNTNDVDLTAELWRRASRVFAW